MKKLANALTILVAVAYTALTVYLWGAMIFTGDEDGFSWRRSIDVFDLYLDLYGILLFSVLSLPAVVLGLWRSAAILGWARDREGVRWAGNLLLGMVVCGLLVITVRYQLWHEVFGTKSATAPAVPSDERLKYPELPLAPEGPFTWEIEDLKGNKIEVAELKGKTLFINIWATWCGYCILEFPSIQRLHEKFKDDPNVMFIVVTAEPAEKVREWIAGKGAEFKLPFYLTKGDFPKKYEPGGYPATHIVAPDGRTAYSHSGAVAWDGEKTVNFLKQLAQTPVTTP